MRLRPSVVGAIILGATVLLVGVGTSAQSPTAAPAAPAAPAASLDPCPPMTESRSTLLEPGAAETQAFGAQNPDFPHPDTAFAGRFHPGEDWAYPADLAGRQIVAIGNGRVVAVGTIGTGDRGGIVVVEHTGPFTVPASTPGAPWSYPAQTVDTIVSVYQGVDPAPGLVVEGCVDPVAPLGVMTAQCAAGVPLPCGDQPAQLHLEIRLPSTLDPGMHSADWSTVGPASASSGGYFLDPQVMVDVGLREPSAFIASLAAPCPDSSASPGASAEPGASADTCPSSSPAPTAAPTPTPGPTPKPIRSPETALLRGVPERIRDSCTPRTASLVTGTIAAVDCHPDSGRIKLLSYFLVRPADARFVFTSRMRQYDLEKGADCAAGKPGIQNGGATLSIGCFVDDEGRANLRFASRKTCPAVYTGVLGTGRDIAALARAFDASVGGQWLDSGSNLAACRSDTGIVSPPPAPTNVVFEVHTPGTPSFPIKPYRLEVTWDQTVDADTTIEVWAVTTCPRRAGRDEGRCLTRNTPLPSSIRERVASAPAGDGSVSWMVPGWEVEYGPVAHDGDIEYWAIVVRAVNANGKSDFVIAINGNGDFCADCTA